MKSRVVRYDPQNDFYSLLGIPSDASLKQVQRAFRRRAKEVHPDRNPHRVAWATEQFRRLNEAYEVLSDAARRQEYDRQRREANLAAYAAAYTADWTPPSKTRASTPPDPRDREAFWEWYRRVKPRYTSRNDPYAAAPDKQSSTDNLLFSPYRYVLLIILFVVLVNMIFIVFGQYYGPMQLAHQREQTAAAFLRAPTQTYVTAFITRCPDPRARITSPRPDWYVPIDNFVVLGTADHPDFDHYELYAFVAQKSGMRSSILLANVHRPVRDGVLVERADLSRLGGARYTLRLTVFLKDGGALPPCEVDIRRY